MDWSIRHQITIIIGAAAVAVLVFGFFVWRLFFVVEPTCFDNRVNGDESGVDCGGSCSLVCQDDSRGLVTLWSRVLPLSGDQYILLAYIENQNPSSGIQELGYQFRIFDDANLLITKKDGFAYIAPNQRIAIYDTLTLSGDGRIPTTSFFNIVGEQIWQKAPDFLVTSPLIIDQDSIDLESFRPKVSARLRNILARPLYDISLVAILYDANNNALVAGETHFERLLAHDEESVVFTWPESISEKVVRYEIIPSVNFFHPGNI